jgi:hypothetical protein
VPKDEAQARKYMTEAAKGGDSKAQQWLDQHPTTRESPNPGGGL